MPFSTPHGRGGRSSPRYDYFPSPGGVILLHPARRPEWGGVSLPRLGPDGMEQARPVQRRDDTAQQWAAAPVPNNSGRSWRGTRPVPAPLGPDSALRLNSSPAHGRESGSQTDASRTDRLCGNGPESVSSLPQLPQKAGIPAPRDGINAGTPIPIRLLVGREKTRQSGGVESKNATTHCSANATVYEAKGSTSSPKGPETGQNPVKTGWHGVCSTYGQPSQDVAMSRADARAGARAAAQAWLAK